MPGPLPMRAFGRRRATITSVGSAAWATGWIDTAAVFGFGPSAVWRPAQAGSAEAVTLVEVSSEPERRDSPAVVRVRGEFDISAVHEVRSVLLAGEAAGPRTLAIDLGDVTHLDSSGLRVLLDAARRASENDRRLIVVAPPEGPVGRILRLTLLSEHLDVVPELGTAGR